MGIHYEISAPGEKYIDREGNEKTRYCRMGVIIETKSGSLMLKVEQIPVGWNGLAFLNTPKGKEEHGGRENEQKWEPDGEDIPF